MSYDSKCYELAETFLDELPEPRAGKTAELAQLIQDTIEEYMREKEMIL